MFYYDSPDDGVGVELTSPTDPIEDTDAPLDDLKSLLVKVDPLYWSKYSGSTQKQNKTKNISHEYVQLLKNKYEQRLKRETTRSDAIINTSEKCRSPSLVRAEVGGGLGRWRASLC